MKLYKFKLLIKAANFSHKRNTEKNLNQVLFLMEHVLWKNTVDKIYHVQKGHRGLCIINRIIY